MVILVSLAIDAIFDPVIGRISDTFRSPWGRRHPFMYASALPIALAIYFLWRPPHGVSLEALAAYTLALLITVRLCVSLYQVPSDSLVPELAPDYHERTSLISYRYFFGLFGGTLVSIILLTVFLRKDASHPLGPLDREAYGAFGLLAAIIVFVSILLSSATTHRYIKQLWQAPRRQLNLAQTFREVFAALTNRSLVVVMASGLMSGVAGGMSATLDAFMNLYFWGLTPQVMGAMAGFTAPASILGIILAPAVSRRFDKKRTMMIVFAFAIFAGVIPVALRLVGLMPPNGSPWIPVILVIDRIFAGALALMGFTIIGSMIADVAEDEAVKSGTRSEGLLFAASGLLPKFTAGFGGLVGNLMLELSHFPVGVKAGAADVIAPSIMRHLALLSLPVGLVLNSLALSVLIFYRIDRKTHEANLEALALATSITEPPTSLPTGAAPAGEPI
jgi:Na+/melibiose symporter-like transporter